jgi:hypothetical protein
MGQGLGPEVVQARAGRLLPARLGVDFTKLPFRPKSFWPSFFTLEFSQKFHLNMTEEKTGKNTTN